MWEKMDDLDQRADPGANWKHRPHPAPAGVIRHHEVVNPPS